MISISSKYQATILIVESNPSAAQVLSALLTSRGYNVVLASLGQEVLEKTENSVDLILMDLLLSDMEGIELCHYLKQSETTRNIPVIILNSDAGRNNEKAQCFLLGADDFISEPFTREDFFASIDRVMEARSGQRAVTSLRPDERLRELRNILENGLIEPHFQPIYFLDQSGLLGIEVLSRPQKDSIFTNPEMLFEAALEFGCYFDLEMMAWRKALDIFQKNGSNQKLFLNCSPHFVH